MTLCTLSISHLRQIVPQRITRRVLDHLLKLLECCVCEAELRYDGVNNLALLGQLTCTSDLFMRC